MLEQTDSEALPDKSDVGFRSSASIRLRSWNRVALFSPFDRLDLVDGDLARLSWARLLRAVALRQSRRRCSTLGWTKRGCRGDALGHSDRCRADFRLLRRLQRYVQHLKCLETLALVHIEGEQNSRDFRDAAEFNKSSAGGQKRIVFLGDSFTAGHGIRASTTASPIDSPLALSNRRPGKYVVANLGIAGYRRSGRWRT